MPPVRPIDQALTELRHLARVARRRPPRIGDAAAVMVQVLSGSRTTAIEERAGGLAFRFEIGDAGSRCSLTCVLHDGNFAPALTPCEHQVATLLCEGRTLAQIARLRGVSINTVKTQVRQLFRKLDVDTRVALVRRLCP
jgi:DNA-binding CsgD family transcriptional regulator